MIPISCTKCHGTVVKDLTIEADVVTSVRVVIPMCCPHCKTPQRIEIQTIMQIEREIRINGLLQRDGRGEEREGTTRTIRSL